ncbi:MAG: sigma 54-interacting transcriptional regulator [Labilithrix sp.]|nr:sigma 54-interacting transcriptional regulator [Labilithrix sp.]
MARDVPTQLDTEDGRAEVAVALARPGLVLVAVGGHPEHLVVHVPEAGLEIERRPEGPLAHASISRRHATVARRGDAWRVVDHDSRNGTFVDGVRVEGEVFTRGRILRLGSAIFLLENDVAPFAAGVKHEDGVVVGATLRGVLERIAKLAPLGGAVHFTGGTGSGKEVAARAFHAASPRAHGPFVAINCATIPPNLAERLLFGARRGAFSGADADVEGYVQAADGGTLFLDEVAELELTVQAKLLRVLETQQVLALGAVKPRPVKLQLCSATMKSLPAEVEAKRFREDLYYRIGRPAIAVPDLGARLEELPHLVELELGRLPGDVKSSSAFLEACMLRPWRGNVRELFQCVREAASLVIGTDAPALRAQHLPPPVAVVGEPAPGAAGEKDEPGTPEHRSKVVAALEAEGQNVSAAARRLGVHRTQLRRWMARYELSRGADAGLTDASADDEPSEPAGSDDPA